MVSEKLKKANHSAQHMQLTEIGLRLETWVHDLCISGIASSDPRLLDTTNKKQRAWPGIEPGTSSR